MGKIISLADEKFNRSTSGKIVKATAEMDAIFESLVLSEEVGAAELVAAMMHRIGYYISLAELEPERRERVLKKMTRIMYTQATKER